MAKTLADKIHDEVDHVEEMAARARDAVRARMAELPAILTLIAEAEASGEIEPGKNPWDAIVLGLEVVAGRVADDVNPIQSETARAAIIAGKARIDESDG